MNTKEDKLRRLGGVEEMGVVEVKEKEERMKKVPKKPCVECDDCIPIGNLEGLCDYPRRIDDKLWAGAVKTVDLFDIEPDCPKLIK